MEHLRKIGVSSDGELLRQGTQLPAQMTIELEAEQHIGAGRYERSPARTAYRIGYRERVWEMRAGELPLRIPKLREGTFSPSLLESAAASGEGSLGRGAGSLSVRGERPEGR